MINVRILSEKSKAGMIEVIFEHNGQRMQGLYNGRKPDKKRRDVIIQKVLEANIESRKFSEREGVQ